MNSNLAASLAGIFILAACSTPSLSEDAPFMSFSSHELSIVLAAQEAFNKSAVREEMGDFVVYAYKRDGKSVVYFRSQGWRFEDYGPQFPQACVDNSMPCYRVVLDAKLDVLESGMNGYTCGAECSTEYGPLPF